MRRIMCIPLYIILTLLLSFVFPTASQADRAQVNRVCPGDTSEWLMRFNQVLDFNTEENNLDIYYFWGAATSLIRMDAWRDETSPEANVRMLLYAQSTLDDPTPRVLEWWLDNDQRRSYISFLDEAGSYCLYIDTDSEVPVQYQFQVTPVLEDNGDLIGLEDMVVDSDGYQQIGLYFFQQTRYEEAIPYYQMAIDNATVGSSATYLANLCNTYYWMGQYETALPYCESALVENPIFRRAIETSANIYTGLRDYANAVEAYSHLIEIEPQRDTWYRMRGVTNLLLGDLASALEDFEQNRLLTRGATYWYGMTYLWLGDFEMAKIEFENYLNYQQRVGESISKFSYIWLAVIAQLDGYEEEAQRWLELATNYQSGIPDNRTRPLTSLVIGDMVLAYEQYTDLFESSTIISNRVYDYVYVLTLAHLFPDNDDYAELVIWFEDQMGLPD